MKTIALKEIAITANVSEMKTSIQNFPLSFFLQEQRPWLLPSRSTPDLGNGFRWMAASPLPFWRQYLGSPPYEARLSHWAKVHSEEEKSKKHLGLVDAIEVPALYDLGISPPTWTAETFLTKTMMGSRVLVFDPKISAGLVLAEIEDWATEQGFSIDDAITAGKVAAFAKDEFTSDICEALANSERIVDFGWRQGQKTVFREYVRPFPKFFDMRYWYTPKVIEGLDSFEGRMVFEPFQGKTRSLCKIHKTEGRTPFDGKRIISTWEDVEPGPTDTYIAVAVPTDESASYYTMNTMFSDVDEVLIPRTHCFGKVTLMELKSFLKRRLGVKVANGQEIATELGKFLPTVEQALMDALGPPRVVSTLKEESTSVMEHRTNRPEAAFLKNVQTTVAKLWESDDDTSVWLANLLCRAVVVLHLRSASIFDRDYRTQMFQPDELLYAIIKSKEHDSASYLAPMLLVAPLGRKKGQGEMHIPQRAKASSPLLGGVLDELFR